MSPKKRRGDSQRRKHGPHDKRRTQVHAARETIPPALLSMMLSAGEDMVRGSGPLEAEVIASSLVGVWWGRELVDADVQEILGEALVAEAGRRRTAESLTLLTALAAVAEGRLAVLAAAAAQQLDQVGVTGPRWLDAVGTAELVGCWRCWDLAGDGISVLVLRAYPHEPPHVLSVMIDRNLGGIVKDAWATEMGEEVLGGYREECARTDLMNLEQIEPVVARALVDRAFTVTDRAIRFDPPVSDETRSHRALAMSWMRQLPWSAEAFEFDLDPDDEAFRGGGWEAERSRFLTTDEVRALGRPRIVAATVDEILAYSEDYDCGRLLRVSPVKVEVMLLDWFPTWTDLSPSQIKILPELFTLWCRHAADLTGLPSALLDETLASLRRFAPEVAARSAQSDTDAARMIREHIAPRDIWDRADQAERLAFALLAEPDGFLLDPSFDTLEDDLFELAARAHPEYDQVLDDGDDQTVEGVSPRAHLALHAAVSHQLWVDDPPDVWSTVRRLLLADYDPHEIHHMLMSAMAEPLRRVLVDEQAFDDGLYHEGLAELPGSWEAQRPAD